MALVNFKNEVLLRVYIVTVAVVLVAVMIFAKAARLVLFEGDKWRAKAVEKYVSYRPVLGERGNILAEDGSLLATSIPYFDIYWDAANEGLDDEIFKQGIDSLAWNLATYIAPQYTPGAWKDFLWHHRYTYKSHYVQIAKNLSFDQTQWLKTFPIFRLGKFKGGLIVIRDNQREHPFKMLALRTLGYIKDEDPNNPIKVGLEGGFNNVLSGDAGKILMQRVGNDVYVPVNDLAEIEPRNGDDVVTTLDVNIQDIVQNALMRKLEQSQAEHGCAIVMEVKTGKIKAIANLGRDPNGKGWWEDYNYAIGRAIEPGSTWKLASMLALLEDEKVRLSDTVDIENGSTKYYDAILEDHERTNKRLVTVKEAFSQSSNVGISKLVTGAYAEKPKGYIKHLKNFMLSVPTNIEVPGEAAPYIKDPENAADQWSGVTLPWMSIGYELQTTPLQLLTFYNAVANNGQMMKPYLVSEVQRYGSTVKSFKPTIIKKRIASQNAIDQAKELLESVVELPGGTAYALRTPQYRFAGKTGTAQLDYSKDKGKLHKGGYQGSFVGYFPAENPVYSCIVVVSKAKFGFYGGTVAAPVFREIADKLMSSNVALSEPINTKGKPVPSALTLPSDAGYKADMLKMLQNVSLRHEILGDKEDGWANVRPSNDTMLVQPRNIGRKEQVPSVVGMGLKDALYILENRGLRVVFSGYGKVVSQSLGVGQPAVRGQTIALKLE